MASNTWVVFSDFKVVNNFGNHFLFLSSKDEKLAADYLQSRSDIDPCWTFVSVWRYNRKGCSWHPERRLQMLLNSVQVQDDMSFPIPTLHTHPQHKQNPKHKLAPNVNSIAFEKTVVEIHGLGTRSNYWLSCLLWRAFPCLCPSVCSPKDPSPPLSASGWLSGEPPCCLSLVLWMELMWKEKKRGRGEESDILHNWLTLFPLLH